MIRFEPMKDTVQLQRLLQHGIFTLFNLLFVILSFYILSIGPAVAFLGETRFVYFLAEFYSPVTWLREHTFLRAPLDWYIKIWSSFQR